MNWMRYILWALTCEQLNNSQTHNANLNEMSNDE